MRKLTFDNHIISTVFEDEDKFNGFKQIMFEAGKQ